MKNLIVDNSVVLASKYQNYQSFFYRLIYCDNNICWGLQIDIFHRGFYYKGKKYYSKKSVQKYIIKHNDIKVLSIDKANYIGFLKEIIHNNTAKEKYTKGFLSLVQSDPEYYKREIINLYGVAFWDTIEQNNTFKKIQNNFFYLGDLMRKSVKPDNFKEFIKFKFENLQRLFRKKPGYTIAILGTDGSGKTTIINYINKYLLESFHSSVIYNHLRPNLIPDIGVLIKKREKNKEVISNPHINKQSGFIISLIRFLYYLFDYSIGYLFKVYFFIKLRSTIFIFDRYYYDYYIDQKRYRIKLPNSFIRLGEFLIPKIDLIVCLGSKSEIIYKRKSETSLDEVEKQINLLKNFCKSRNNAVWIDTSMKIEESVNLVMKEIVQMMNERFKKENL